MFCPHPFNRVEIKADGSVYCCCEGWLPRSLGNLLETHLLDIWQGQTAQEIRASVRDGSFRHCTACPYLPGPGGPVVESPKPETEYDRIETLKLDYDQTCQLRCPSCRVTHSREFVDDNRVARIHAAVMASGALSLTNRLYATGAGDPFASPVYWKMLRELHLLDLSSNPGLTVFLHTNGLLCDEAHWRELHPATQDRITEIGISVDAASEDTYRKIRGGSWSKLWSNISFLNKMQAAGKRLRLGMFYTVQAANYRELLPFVRLARHHNVGWISVTALRNWGTFTKDDYLERAVHLPGHPEHDMWRTVISDERLTGDPRIILDRFNPEHTDQEVVCNAKALLPAGELSRRRP